MFWEWDFSSLLGQFRWTQTRSAQLWFDPRSFNFQAQALFVSGPLRSATTGTSRLIWKRKKQVIFFRMNWHSHQAGRWSLRIVWKFKFFLWINQKPPVFGGYNSLAAWVKKDCIYIEKCEGNLESSNTVIYGGPIPSLRFLNARGEDLTQIFDPKWPRFKHFLLENAGWSKGTTKAAQVDHCYSGLTAAVPEPSVLGARNGGSAWWLEGLLWVWDGNWSGTPGHPAS